MVQEIGQEVLSPEQMLSWQTLAGWPSALALVLGLALAVFVARRPRWFWPLLLVFSLVGNLPKIAGYFVLDELLVGFLVCGALLRLCFHRTPGGRVARPAVERVVFMLWAAYMAWESLRGMLVNGDSRILRWIAYYALLAVLSSILYLKRGAFPFPSPRQVWLLIVGTTLVYYSVYLAQGVYADLTLAGVGLWGEVGRFRTQNTTWAGSAVAVYPNLLAMPASMALLDDPSRRVRWSAWTLIAMMMVVAFYFDSRVSWFVILANFAVSVRKLRLWHSVAIVLVFGIAFVGLQGKGAARSLSEFRTTLVESTELLSSPARGDIGRKLDLQAAFLVMTDRLPRFLVGAGVGSHKYLIGSYVLPLYEQFLPDPVFEFEPGSPSDPYTKLAVYRTTGAATLIIDAGMIGLLLLALVFGSCAHTLLFCRSPDRVPLLAALGLACLWLLVANTLDVVLSYLLIMPGGLLSRLAGGPSPVLPLGRRSPSQVRLPSSGQRE